MMEAAVRKAERKAEAAAHSARHAQLLVEHAASPILLALLHAHVPVVSETGWMECNGCTASWDRDYSEPVPADGPCPTWELISKGA